MLIMHKRGHLLCQGTLQSFGRTLEEENVPAMTPGVAQLTAASRKSRSRWEREGETQFGTIVELLEGMEGIPWHWDEGGMCLETNPAGL